MQNYFADMRKNSQKKLADDFAELGHILLDDPVVQELGQHFRAVNSYILSKYRNRLFLTAFEAVKMLVYKKIEDITTHG